MCKYSLEAYNTRRAVNGETLVANMHSGRGHGVLTKPGTSFDGTLTCVRDGTLLTIENLGVVYNAAAIMGSYGLRLHGLEYVGKRVVAELIDGRGLPSAVDCLRIIDDKRRARLLIPLMVLAPGSEVYVGVKKEVTLDEKLGLDDKSLRAIAADDPKDKPDDEDKEKEKEGEEEPKPDIAALPPRDIATLPSRFGVRRRVPLWARF